MITTYEMLNSLTMAQLRHTAAYLVDVADYGSYSDDGYDYLQGALDVASAMTTFNYELCEANDAGAPTIADVFEPWLTYDGSTEDCASYHTSDEPGFGFLLHTDCAADEYPDGLCPELVAYQAKLRTERN